MNNTYTLWLTDNSGNRILPIDDFVDESGASLTYVRSVNAVSPLTLTLPIDRYEYLFRDPQLWVDTRIEVWRRVNGGAEYLDTETVWFVRGFRKKLTQKVFQVTAHSANQLLDRAIVAYAAASAQAQKTDNIDDLMKAIVRENLGSSAGVGRVRTGFTVQADASLGTSTTKAFSYRNVLDVLQDLAQESGTTAAPIFFDIVGVITVDGITSIEFRTYANQRGLDRTYASQLNGITLSTDDSTLNDAEIAYDFSNEINAIYVGGSGQEADRIVVAVSDTARINTSPLNRSEGFVNYSNSNVTSVLQSAGYAVLRDSRPKKIITANIQNTTNLMYGRDWYWGDKVTAQVDTDTFNARIDAVQVSITGGKEDIKAMIKGEL